MKFISRSLLGLLAVLVLLVVGLCIALEPLLHYGIQKYGSQAYGAQVDVGDVEVDFWPLGVAIYDLEMTDPAQPTQNSVQVAEIASLGADPAVRAAGDCRACGGNGSGLYPATA